ncbi:acyltransferase family protein [Cereibacter johrii]|uniref:acyltransferase family protein n=1 Tax=Cereibacter johrii TaxID=445629 RepID=UPI0008466A80|nr:acyltransferase family protein [Cereibacter johrii]ODM42347.1 serine racemase [Cereibacter johrii]
MSPSAALSPPLRNLSLDALKIVMAVMVVGLHAGFLRDLHPMASDFFTNCLFRIAVPTFLVINGYYLERQLDRGLRVWARRGALLYGIWMALYAPLWLPGALKVPAFGREVLVFGYYHLWYLLALLLAGLLVAALRPLGERVLAGIALLAFACGVGIQYAGNFHLFEPPLDDLLNRVQSYRNFLFMGFPFLVAGVLIARHEERLARFGTPAVLAAASALLLAEWGANMVWNREDPVFEIFASLALVCPALFLTVKNRRLMGRSRDFGQFATALYLVHIAVLHFTYDVEMGDTLRTLIGLCLASLLAVPVVLAARRLPIL